MHEPYCLPSIDPDEAIAGLAAGSLTLIDLRKTKARIENGRAIAGTAWVDPFALDHGHALTCAEGPIALFCVHGHEVSQFGCALLRLHGRDAVYVAGGFEALAAAGAPLVPIGDAPPESLA